MNKAQYWTLNFVGGFCALLILANLILSRSNERSGESYLSTQNQLERAQQVQTTIQNLAVRVAQAARTDAALSNLLARHELKVNFNEEAPAKPAP